MPGCCSRSFRAWLLMATSTVLLCVRERGRRREFEPLRLVEGVAGADDADAKTFDEYRLAAQIDLDRLEVRVFGEQTNPVPIPLQALDSDIVVDASNDDLTITRFGGFVYREQVSVENAGIAHTHAAHFEQVIRTGDRKSTRLNSSHVAISYAVFCLKQKLQTS